MSFLDRWNRHAAHIVSAKGEALEIGRTRLRIVRSLCLVLLALVVIRLFDLTVVQKPREPDNDYAIDQSGQIIERADIVDRNGVLLATTLQVPSLYADPTLIENKAYIAKRLETILKIDGVDEKLDKKGRFVWIKRGITPEEHYEINALGSPGLGFRAETRRFYPQGKTMAHLVGYTSVDGKGLAGIERYYNDRLQKGGAPLELATDVRVQYALVKALKDKMQMFQAKGASGGIIDIETGGVLAAASIPDFDPHHAGRADKEALFNRFALGVYEMGSTFKLFSTAAYLEKTKRPFTQTFDAREPIKFGGYTINDFHAQERVLTLPEVFIHSSNIGSAMMGRDIGTEALQDFYRDLGLLDRMSIDFPALGTPLLPNPWRETDTLTASYGHGIAVSPLHVLQATAVIANGGERVRLSFAKPEPRSNLIRNRIISTATAHKMRQLMRLNVTNGSGAKADVAGHAVGGKTGTSIKVAPEGGYDRNRVMTSFIGVFPAHAPRYAILAILDEPKGTRETFGYATAGWTVAPAVGDIVADMTRILGMSASSRGTDLTAGLDRYISQPEEGGLSPVNFVQ